MLIAKVNAMNKEIFVFGSNLAGRHGKGAALDARIKHGAVYGIGVGMTGNSYAIPTKGHNLEVLPLSKIAQHVEQFKNFATENKQYTFNITRVGCGLAGYTDEQMAPLFNGCPPNCILPKEWSST